jgi:hypothetical protein
MAPNFNINDIALFECSAADLQLAPVAHHVKIINAPVPVASAAPVAVVENSSDKSNYWEEHSSNHSQNGMTAARMEIKQAGLARVQATARIEARRAASVQSHAFSSSGVEESLKKDGARRSALYSVTSDSSSDSYWNELIAPQEERCVGRVAEEPVDYWTHSASDCDGTAVDKHEQKNDAVKRVEEMIRLHNRMEEYRAAEEFGLSAHCMLSQHVQCTAATGDCYWVH